MSDPYRTAADGIVEFQPGFFWRIWYKIFGHRFKPRRRYKHRER